jgi:hypothetical protein
MTDTNTTYLNIGDKYRVSRDDERNLMLEHFKSVTSHANRHQAEKKTVDKWVWVGFFPNLNGVLNRVLDESIGATLDGEIHDVISVIDDLKQELMDAVEEAGTKLESFPKGSDGRGNTVEVAKVETPKKKTAVKKSAVKKPVRKYKAKAKA